MKGLTAKESLQKSAQMAWLEERENENERLSHLATYPGDESACLCGPSDKPETLQIYFIHLFIYLFFIWSFFSLQ